MAGELIRLTASTIAVKKALRELPKQLRRRALRNSLAAAGRVFRDEARRRAPVLKVSTYAGRSALQRGIRAIGTLRRAISVRTSKRDTRNGDVGVFVNVRPLKGGSARNPKDPFYWRWQEFGWQPATGPRRGGSRAVRRADARPGTGARKPGAFFLRGATGKSSEALRAFEQTFAPQVQRFQQGLR
jgi:hypothetical protein